MSCRKIFQIVEDVERSVEPEREKATSSDHLLVGDHLADLLDVAVVDAGQDQISQVTNGRHVGQLPVVNQLMPDFRLVAEPEIVFLIKLA